MHLGALTCRLGSAIAATPTMAPLPLLQCMAHRAFDKMPKTALLHVARHVHCEHSAADTLVQVLAKLLEDILPESTPDDRLQILQKRARTDDVLLEFLQRADGEAWSEEADEQKDFETLAAQGAQQQRDDKEYTKEFEAFKRSRKSTPREQHKSVAKRLNQLGRDYPAKLPTYSEEAKWEVENLRAYLPPDDSRLYRDPVNKRWQVYWPNARRSRSSSWLMHGVAGAAKRSFSSGGCSREFMIFK